MIPSKGKVLRAREVGRVSTFLLCLLNTPRFARGTQYPLLWIHSIILLPPLCRSIYLSLSLAQGGSRRLSSAHTHTYAQALRISFSLSLFLPFSFPFTLLPLSPSRVQRSVLSLAALGRCRSSLPLVATTEISRRLIAAISCARSLPRFGFLVVALCHEFMGRAVCA